MNPHQTPAPPRNRSLPAFQITSLVLFLVLGAVGIVSSTAQSAQKEGRELEDKIPKHLPIKVKVKNLQNEKWARELEVEVKNDADKPIYFLNMYLILPEAKSPDGKEIGFPLRYGRIELIKFDTPVEPTDVPIQPGATHVFKIAEKNLKGWESLKENKPDPKKFRLIITSLNFGDGTGFQSPDAYQSTFIKG